jgi:hypothetical protein
MATLVHKVAVNVGICLHYSAYEFCPRQVLVKSLNIKFHENPSEHSSCQKRTDVIMQENDTAFHNFQMPPKGQNALCKAKVHQLLPLPVCQQPRISVGEIRNFFLNLRLKISNKCVRKFRLSHITVHKKASLTYCRKLTFLEHVPYNISHTCFIQIDMTYLTQILFDKFRVCKSVHHHTFK